MSLRALHLFGQYLHETENWAYRLIRDLPDCSIVVGAERFLRTNFYDPRFEFIEFPFRPWDVPRRNLIERAANALICHALLPFYPRWLAGHAGRVDIIHAHFGFIGWRFLATSKLLGAPLVVSFYGADYARLPNEQPVWRKRYHELFSAMAMAFCEGEHGRRQLIGLGCPPDKVQVLHLGVNSAEIAAKAPDKQAGQLRLVQVATLREKKGHLFTIRAFRHALETCPGMTLTLVGSDPEERRERLKRELGPAESAVTFLDGIDFTRLHEFLRQFDVFIHPSVHAANGDCEGGAPVVLLDAQAVGLPVIAARHCDIPDEVLDGETGLLADERDVEGLSKAIRRFYSMEAGNYAAFSARAVAHVAHHYDATANARLLRATYQTLTSRSHPLS